MTETQMIIFGVSFIFVMTTAGAALIYFFKEGLSPKLNTIFLGFAAGIMIAASIWSLLIPAIDQSEFLGNFAFVPAALGFLLGGLFLYGIDKIVPHFHSETKQEEGMKTKLSKSTKLFLAMAIHNIPEGLAVGFAFGVALVTQDATRAAAFTSALGLAIGIGLQNFPEGAAVSLPMAEELGSRNKAFGYGAFSGILEPIAAVIGIILATSLTTILPWFLAFAAGAMIYVVVEELIPDSHVSEHPHLGTWAVMVGFVIMMILDVALG
ncbi:ZIP family metal transporter [Acholeplasma equirhinis]|uniref:ZIP family metal transporter n=1 Tax=Acholeplasma equirhinis TaxID=555393 RepID=UPI00197AA12F|nr:ZIP family metal transporter [Acholeplasma equirhinis]MBN3490116.1 ZIP family metal transporter [Acholeplasma equirhinis]